MSVALVCVAAERARADGCDGGVVSPGGGGGGGGEQGDVAIQAERRCERLPAASYASIPTSYVEPHDRPAKVADGSEDEAFGKPVRYRPYPTTPRSSVDGSHARMTAVWLVVDWRKPEGAEGGVASEQAAVETVACDGGERLPARS